MTCDQGPWAFVGDLHGRVHVLEKILDRDPAFKYHYVFVGDILHHKPFFRYSKRLPSTKILQKVEELVSSGNATLILGNNENYVLRSLVMADKDIRKGEVKNTLKSLKEVSLQERLKYISMLSSAPLSLELDNKYRLAHAYYPHSTQTLTRDSILHGPGYPWFKDSDLSRHSISPDYRYFFGHWGSPYWRENITVLDATSMEAVGVYYTDRDEFTIFY